MGNNPRCNERTDSFYEEKLSDINNNLEVNFLAGEKLPINDYISWITDIPIKLDYSNVFFSRLCDIITLLWSYEKIQEVSKLLNKVEEIFSSNSREYNDFTSQIFAKVIFYRGCVDASKGNFNEAYLLFEKALNISLDSELNALISINIGILLSISGKNRIAQDKYNEALRIFKKFKNPVGISLVYNHLGTINLNLREYDDAMINFRKSMGIREKQNCLVLLIPVYNNVGEVYRIWGEIDTALKYYQQGLKITQQYENHKKKLVNELSGFEWLLEPWSYGTINLVKAMENHKTILLFNLGLIYHSKGDYSKAFSHFQQTLLLDRKVKDNQVTVETLFHLIFLACENGYHGEATSFFDEIQKIYISNKNNSTLISEYYLVSNALILRSKENIRDFAESIEILEEIRTQDIISSDLKRYALTFLMEAYLTELRLFNNPISFKKAYDLASEIESLAWKEKSTLLLLFMNQIKAKLAYIQMKYDESKNFLEAGLEIAQNKGFWQFAGYFFHELQELISQQKTHELEDHVKISLKERIEVAKLDVIISHISQNQIVNIVEFPSYAMNVIKGVLFEMSDLGPIPVISENLEDLLPLKQTTNELQSVLLQKLALLYTISIGQGNTPNYGLYGPLPIPDYPGYVALTYSFKIRDKKIKDIRMKEKTFAILSFLMPEIFTAFFAERDLITDYLNDFLGELNDIEEITSLWISEIKQKIIELK